MAARKVAEEQGTMGIGGLRERLLATEGALPTGALGRLWRGGRSAAGVGAALLKGRRGEALDEAALAALTLRLGELKGLAMKAGQMVGYFDTSVPPELRAALSLLQTAAPTTPFVEVERVVREALGPRAEELLASMERAPVAVASIGQVHRARLADGTCVAVKVRHPGIEQAMVADFRGASWGGSMAALMGAGAVRGMIDEARTAMLEECDFSLEAERQERFGAIYRDDPAIAIAPVERALCAPAVLVSRWLPGRSLDEHLGAGAAQAERDRVGEALFRFWMQSLYEHGLLHGDPHPGNFAIAADGRVVVYDFGCVRELPPGLRRGIASLADAVCRDDLDGMVAGIVAMGGRAPQGTERREQLRRLLRSFFGPLVPLRGRPARRRIDPDEGVDARSMLADKRFLIALELPSRLLFVFRLRFGLYAVLARIGAEVDWSALERRWAQAIGGMA